MKKEPVVVGAVVSVLAAAAFFVLWLQKSDPLAGVGVEALAERQVAAPVPPAPPPTATLPARRAEPPPATASVLFDFDSATLGAAEAAKLDRLIEAHAKRPQFGRVEAVGHADRIGAAAYNMKLSARRAAAVRDYFVGRSIEADKVRTAARGELDSVTGDSCFQMGAELKANAGLVGCLQADRRVEVSVITSL